MQKSNTEEQKNPRKKISDFKVGDLIKIKDNAHFVEENFVGAAGLIVAFNETGYPKGFSGRAKDSMMYTVAAQGQNIKLFEDEMEKIQ